MPKPRQKSSTEGSEAQRRSKERGNGQGTIYLRSRDNKHVAELTVGWDEEGKRKVIRFAADTRKEAEAWLRKQLQAREEGAPPAPSKETVAQFFDNWLQTTVAHEVSPTTLLLYQNMLNWYIRPNLGRVPLAELSPRQIQQLYHKLMTEGKSARTIQLVHVVLRRGLKQAVEWGDLPKSPLEGVKQPRAERKEMNVLTPEQLAKFIQAAKGERLHALFILTATVGLRMGEVLGLRWSDVDLEAGTITIAQSLKKIGEKIELGAVKTAASRRTIDLPKVALDALKRWRREQAAERLKVGEAWQRPDLVFTTVSGTPIRPNNLRKREFRELLEKAGLPRIRFHDLRHSAATLMAMQGVSDRVLQEVLGHSTITITKSLYVHVLRHQKKEAAEKVDAFLAATEREAQ